MDQVISFRVNFLQTPKNMQTKKLNLLSFYILVVGS